MIVVRNGSVTPSVTGWRPVDALGVSAAARAAWAAATCSSRAVWALWARVAALTPSAPAISPSVRAAWVSAGAADFR